MYNNMYRHSCFRIFIFIFLFPRLYGDISFNSLQQRLVMKLVSLSHIKNVVASEQLVRFPLCKLASVATGDAKRELMLFLGYRDDVALSRCYRKVKGFLSSMKRADLTLTNRIYVSYTDDIDPKFVQNSTENDGIQVEKVGFIYPKAATAHINNLINSMTFKRITDIVDANDINNSTKMIIISGAHFKGTWESPFDYRMTKLMKFNHIDGKISRIPMMSKIGDFQYNKGSNCEVVSIKFQAFAASLTIVLPKTEKELSGILQRIYLEKGYVGSLTKKSQVKTMVVTIPRFKIKTFVDWTGFLQELGLYSIFNTNSSDLAAIYKKGQNKTIALSKIKQKVFIQIDEMGVYRRPQDSKKNDDSTLPYYNLPKFVADRPFYFEIAWDLNDGQGQRYELFSGVYYGPEPDRPAF